MSARRPSKISRRGWMQTLVAASAAAAAPAILTRHSRAATNVFGQARHVLVLYARGGLRSHCLFNAVGSAQHNPYGVLDRASTSSWAPGAVMGAADIETESFGVVPGFHAAIDHTAVVASVDLAPEAPRPVVDHDPAVVLLGTAVEGSGQGLLSRLLQSHPRYAAGVGVENVPPVDIGNTTFGRTDTQHVPLRLPGAASSVARRSISRSWGSQLRDSLNAQFESRTPGVYADRVQRLVDAKANAFAFSSVLVDPRLDILGAPEAEDHGLTNAQMLEVLGNDDLADLGDPESERSWGPDVALALRMFEFGAPMAVVERDLYDTHSNEDESLPVRAADLVRQLAGVRFLLQQMEHPEGGSFWDKTVVTVVSEFNRNNTEDNGYNSGRGSDHVLNAPEITRNQAVPLMGGIIERAGLGGRLIGSTDAEMVPGGPMYSMRSLYSTLLDVLGAEHAGHWADEPIAELFG